MIDANTNKPMKILPNGTHGGILQIAAGQVDGVLKLFQECGLRCWRSPEEMTINGGPPWGTVMLSQNVHPDVAQAVLDSLP